MSMDSIYFDTMLILVNNCAWNMVCWCVPKKKPKNFDDPKLKSMLKYGSFYEVFYSLK